MGTSQHIPIAMSNIEKALSKYKTEFDVLRRFADMRSTLMQCENISLYLHVAGRHSPHMTVERESAKSCGTLKRLRDGRASAYIEEPWSSTVEIMAANLEGSQQ